tara:strand:- start:211247 stop:212671 length:1425 start_codon:yes stop_codon:yes gene_type:complete
MSPDIKPIVLEPTTLATKICLDMNPTRRNPLAILAGLLCVCFCVCCNVSADDSWPQFRGPNGDGIALGQNVPIEFGEKQNVSWKTEIPGRAWSSPVVADGVVWLTTAIEKVPDEDKRIALLRAAGVEEKKLKIKSIAESILLQLVSVDLATGKILKSIDLGVVEGPDSIHSQNTYASPTPVIDGQRIYCHFGTFGTFCLDRVSGQKIWERLLPLEHKEGPGSSPIVYKNILVLIQDGVDRQYVAALDKMTGETLWETERPEMDAPDGDQKKSYCTPVALSDMSGRDQVICLGAQWMVSYDPKTGDELWKVRHGSGFSVVPRPVVKDDIVFFATGFGKPELWAVRIDGSGDVTETHVLWREPKGISKKPSPLLHDGLIYIISDDGIASCFSSEDGELIWKKRVGGDYSSSPLFAGGHIYFGSHDGKVTVLKPGADGEIVAENQIEGQIMASPVAVDNALLIRSDKALYRFESPKI